MVVAVVLGVVLGMALSLCLAARGRLARFSDAAREQFDATRAAELLARDIRAAREAREDQGALVLSGGAPAEVRWAVRAGRLVRSAGTGQRTFSVPVAGMRLKIESGLVEVSLRTAAPVGRPTMPFYVAARPRGGGGGR